MLEHPSHLKAYCRCARRWEQLKCADKECSRCEELENQMEFHWYRLSDKGRKKANAFHSKLVSEREGDK
jgi:hypothetical protein